MICLSLCIVSAAKELGPQFGMNLNKGKGEQEAAATTTDKIKNTLGKLTNDLKLKK